MAEITSESTSKPSGKGNGGHLQPAPPWKPGQSGNPKGKPKGKRDSVRACLRRFLRKNAPAQAVAKLRAAGVEIDDGTVAEVLADVLALKAMGGDVQAIKEVNAQTEEPLKTTTKIEGNLSVATHEMSDAELARIIQGHDSSDNGGD